MNNLIKEGIPAERISVTGNTVIDALQWIIQKQANTKGKKNHLKSELLQLLDFDLNTQRFILITGHRRENFGDGFVHICKAIKALAQQHTDIKFVYPVHLNPNVLMPVKDILGIRKMYT